MHIILKGRAEVIEEGHWGRRGYIETGAACGDQILFGSSVRTLTVRAVNLCICNACHRDVLRNALSQFPDSRDDFQDMVGAKRVKATDEAFLKPINTKSRIAHLGKRSKDGSNMSSLYSPIAAVGAKGNRTVCSMLGRHVRASFSQTAKQ